MTLACNGATLDLRVVDGCVLLLSSSSVCPPHSLPHLLVLLRVMPGGWDASHSALYLNDASSRLVRFFSLETRAF
jgi:hypothetical protein